MNTTTPDITVKQNRKSPGKEWIVSDGINTVEIYRDTDTGYLWCSDQQNIATSKGDAIAWATGHLASMVKPAGILPGARVKRITGDSWQIGKTGSVVEIADGRARVMWDGDKRTWVSFQCLDIIG